MKLTIGMACYDDFDGVYFSLQALRLYHPEVMHETELLMVDNHPDGPHGAMVRGLMGWIKGDVAAARYVAAPEITGTAAPRERVFREAAGDYVVCMDAHVFVYPLGLIRLLRWFEDNPGTRDLLSGPMLYDDLKNIATHFEPVWREEMYGVWGTDPRGDDRNGEPFEIPGMGLGLFACRKAAWPGFNPHFRGFGGEELYIHEKVRRQGGRALCLPFLRWLHRFGRPGGVKYPLSLWHKCRNYVLGHAELGWSLDPVKAHFVDTGRVPLHEWQQLAADPLDPPESPAPVQPPPLPPEQGCGCGIQPQETLADLYKKAADTPSDINEHVPKLRELASQADVVVEFGMRHGVSTVALLAGQPQRLVSVDLNVDAIAGELKKRQGQTDFEFRQGNSLAGEPIPCDLLFIDTKHTAAQVIAELQRHAPHVRRRIAFHDTVIFGETGEDGSPGLLVGIRGYLQEFPDWSVVYHATNNHGFTVISRDPADKPKLPGVITMAANFAKAVAAHVASGGGAATPATYQKRLEICTLCDQRSDGRCAACGCHLEEKAKWPTSFCPLGKWGPEAESKKAAGEVPQ